MNVLKRMFCFVTLAVMLAVLCTSSALATTLFQDDFTDGDPNAEVGVNAPGTGAANNASLSGSIISSFDPNGDAYNTANLGVDEENGTTYTFDTATNGQRGAFQLDFDLATAVVGGELSVSFDDLNPIVGGGGSSANWFGFSLATTQGGIGGPNVKANDANAFGVLVRDNGEILTFNLGGSNPSATTGAGSHDVALNLTNFVIDAATGGFDWEILVNGASVSGLSGNVSSVVTSSLYLTMETTSSPSELGQLLITTGIPEPASMLLGLMGVVGLAAVRSRKI